ncbi:MAG: Spi family protease inhibitor, partial [Bacteroidales bacterium]|nr:Spi family protease inhibitor [Bacteroidales bacterium]
MKKTLLFIAIFAMTVGTIFANPVDRQRAQQIGQNFMNAKIGQKTDVQLNLVYTAATREAVDYYVFNNGGDNGFVIVAGDDRVKPILAYSTSGCFNPNDIA